MCDTLTIKNGMEMCLQSQIPKGKERKVIVRVFAEVLVVQMTLPCWSPFPEKLQETSEHGTIQAPGLVGMQILPYIRCETFMLAKSILYPSGHTSLTQITYELESTSRDKWTKAFFLLLVRALSRQELRIFFADKVVYHFKMKCNTE